MNGPFGLISIKCGWVYQLNIKIIKKTKKIRAIFNECDFFLGGEGDKYKCAPQVDVSFIAL